MTDISIIQIEENIKNLLLNFSPDTFIYDLLLAYGKPKSSISRLKKGDYNKIRNKNGTLLWAKELFFKSTKSNNFKDKIKELVNKKEIIKYKPRFILITNYHILSAFDTKKQTSIEIKIQDLHKYVSFFIPWAGREKTAIYNENPADLQAAKKIAILYDQIQKNNSSKKSISKHALNTFFARLLFCFFAESTDIFKHDLFTRTIESHTNEDGKDLDIFLTRLFQSLDHKNKTTYPNYLQRFPYVNGALFSKQEKMPYFCWYSRKLIIESGKLDWSLINPDIFGSMIQSIADPDERNAAGMHYTSVSNIIKVIRPLFLDELYTNFNKNKNNINQLKKLLKRIYSLKIFDPACGSGNFLIIAYKELRQLEITIFQHIEKITGDRPLPISNITLSQFHGIEINEFAQQLALLSLWIAEHQMNMQFKKKLGKVQPSLPLKDCGHIIADNAIRVDWESVCPKEKISEIYILGNPPYSGTSLQTKAQKAEMKNLFHSIIPKSGNLDYIACWFFKASEYIHHANAKYAFVSTNSICQGLHIPTLWPYIFKKHLEIEFAYKGFKWKNHALDNAGVTCIIIGVRNISKNNNKYLYNQDNKQRYKNINAYLIDYKNIFIKETKTPISPQMPIMTLGSMPVCGSSLLLVPQEYNHITNLYPEIKQIIKKAIGSREFLYKENRYCLWIEDNDLSIANNIPEIVSRIANVKRERVKSSKLATQKLSKTPHKFGEIRYNKSKALLIPRVSSEFLSYIPIGYIDAKSIILDSAQAIYHAEHYVFGIISSHLHMVWTKTLAGQLETRYRYSSTLCYNTFPVPKLSKQQKEIIKGLSLQIIAIRNQYPEKTIAYMYHANTMPTDLRHAHHNLDLIVEKCYRSKPFKNDSERLEHLFQLYEKTTSSQ